MNLKVPAKTFLVGEYAVLNGETGLVITHEPYFEFGPTGVAPHPESPAGRLGCSNAPRLLESEVTGSGGFGASTAEFLAAWLNQNKNSLYDDWWKSCFKSFKNLNLPGNPSGVDLVAQIVGGISEFSPKELSAKMHTWPFDDIRFQIYKTGNKVKSHEHLLNLQNLSFSNLTEPLQKTLQGFLGKKSLDFIEGVNSYRKALRSLNLEVPATSKILDALVTQPGVLAVKGCGALGADAFIVFSSSKFKMDLGFQLVATDQSLSRGVQWS